ncbi:hypothetical protein [Serratia sp. BNK-4]|uniref:hypothetical protein n=1 Tax=Serratia sp. BNK-4 TaxID=3376141 RepID=UPI003B43B7A1
MAKPINFEGAELRFCGGLTCDDVYIRRSWAVKLADGTRYQRATFAKLDEPGLEMWEKWCEPGPDACQSPHWRKASKADRMQLQQWLRAHPDYLPDGGPCG